MRELFGIDIIQPSLFSVGAGFFFLEKKDKTFHQCMDNWRLDDILIFVHVPGGIRAANQKSASESG